MRRRKEVEKEERGGEGGEEAKEGKEGTEDYRPRKGLEKGIQEEKAKKEIYKKGKKEKKEITEE